MEDEDWSHQPKTVANDAGFTCHASLIFLREASQEFFSRRLIYSPECYRTHGASSSPIRQSSDDVR